MPSQCENSHLTFYPNPRRKLCNNSLKFNLWWRSRSIQMGSVIRNNLWPWDAHPETWELGPTNSPRSKSRAGTSNVNSGRWRRLCSWKTTHIGCPSLSKRSCGRLHWWHGWSNGRSTGIKQFRRNRKSHSYRHPYCSQAKRQFRTNPKRGNGDPCEPFGQSKTRRKKNNSRMGIRFQTNDSIPSRGKKSQPGRKQFQTCWIVELQRQKSSKQT